jgi:general secretion pathway protein N
MKIRYWAGAVLVYLLVLLATAPADILFWAVNRFAPGRLAVEGVRGTLWHGELRRVSLVTRGGAVDTGPLVWNVRPLRLLLGELALDARLGGAASGTADISLAPRGVNVRRLDLTVPAAWLGAMSSNLEMWQLAGTLSMRCQDFVLYPDAYRGQGEIAWREAASGFSSVKPLGDYRAEISGVGKVLRFSLTTGAGPLELKGDGEWSAGRLKFEGTARALAREAELHRVLGMTGAPEPDGRYRITLGR